MTQGSGRGSLLGIQPPEAAEKDNPMLGDAREVDTTPAMIGPTAQARAEGLC